MVLRVDPVVPVPIVAVLPTLDEPAEVPVVTEVARVAEDLPVDEDVAVAREEVVVAVALELVVTVAVADEVAAEDRPEVPPELLETAAVVPDEAEVAAVALVAVEPPLEAERDDDVPLVTEAFTVATVVDEPVPTVLSVVVPPVDVPRELRAGGAARVGR